MQETRHKGLSRRKRLNNGSACVDSELLQCVEATWVTFCTSAAMGGRLPICSSILRCKRVAAQGSSTPPAG